MNVTWERRSRRRLATRAAVLCSLVFLLLGLAPLLPGTGPVRAATGSVGGLGLQGATMSSGLVASLAVKSDGSLWGWGYAVLYDTLKDTTTIPLIPTRAGTANDWASVATGVFDAFAIKTDGTLWEIGYDEGPVQDGLPSLILTTTQVGKEAHWKVVATGLFLTLAVKDDGTLWSLGYDFLDEDDPESDLLASATRVGADSTWTAVSCGGATGMGLKADGTIWSIEEVLVGDELEDFTSLYEVKKADLATDWVALSDGGGHVLAVKSNGSLWAWGDNSYGELGDGSTEKRLTPMRVGTDSDWASADAGLDYSLALKTDGTLWAWGKDSDGELGDGKAMEQHAPVRIGTSNKWAAVDAGYSTSIAMKTDGTLWAWGVNFGGQVGDGTTETRYSPVQILTDVKLPPGAGGGGGPQITFTDVAGSPYEAAIYDLAGRGIITGFEGGLFKPDDPVSRQQFAKMIVKALGLPVTGSEVCLFTDVLPQTGGSDPFYPAKYVAVCLARAITQGKTATTFDPYNSITHQQLITMVVRSSMFADPPAGFTPSFSSKQFALEEHFRNARKAAYAGVLDGLQGVGASYNFAAPTARGECAQLLHNLLGMLESRG